MGTDFSGSCKLYMPQINEASINMLTDLENFIRFINDNGGFTVVKWYKIGVINDKTLVYDQKINNGNGENTATNYNNYEKGIQVGPG